MPTGQAPAAGCAMRIRPEDPRLGRGGIIVTAQKRAENLQEVPISIVAVSAETLGARSDARRHPAPRARPQRATIGSGWVSYTYVRGAGTSVLDSADPSVAFFIEKCTSPAPPYAVRLLDVQQVESAEEPAGHAVRAQRRRRRGQHHHRRPEESSTPRPARPATTAPLTCAASPARSPATDRGAIASAGHHEADAFTDNPAGVDPGYIDATTARGQLQYVSPNFMALFTGDYFTSDGMTNFPCRRPSPRAC